MSLDDRLRRGLDSAASQLRPDVGVTLARVLDRRRRHRYLRGLQGLAAAAAVVAAILVIPQVIEGPQRGSDDSSRRSIAPAAALPPSGPLSAGTYLTGDISPAFQLQVPAGWRVAERSSAHLALQTTRATKLTLVRLEGVFPPGRPANRSELTAPPDDLMVWLEAHPDLNALGPAGSTIDIGGQEARYLDATVVQNPATTSQACGNPCVAVTAAATAFPITASGGHSARFVDFEIDGIRMLSIASAPANRFEDFVLGADSVVGSIRSQN